MQVSRVRGGVLEEDGNDRGEREEKGVCMYYLVLLCWCLACRHTCITDSKEGGHYHQYVVHAVKYRDLPSPSLFLSFFLVFLISPFTNHICYLCFVF